MDFNESKQTFIDTWGALGSVWGINKSMAQVQAYLLASSNPVSTDELMDALKISRGNANMSLRQLVDYGIIYKKVIAGDRKEYFVAEKDVWKWAMKIGIMRKQKEIDPIMHILKDITDSQTKNETDEAKEFYETVGDIQAFTDQLGTLADKILHSTRGELMVKLMKLIL